MLNLTPNAFVTVDQMMPRLKRTSGAEDDIEQRLIDAINGATQWMEAAASRLLKARNHRTAVTIACTASSASQAFAGTGFTANVEVGDDMVGTGVAVGSQVQAIASAIALTS